MKKTEFVEAIAKKADCSKAEAAQMLDAIGAVTLEAMAKNDFVPFAFGKIGGKHKDARTARNPRTGDSVAVPAKDGTPYAKFNSAAKE